jgi:ATP-dependent exoDNAse (exonuclease V) alpha subunit
VLRQRGCESVSTIHRLIYDSYYDAERRRFTHALKDELTLGEIGLIVVDEASMVNETIGRELLSFKRPTLIIQDPAQLAPPDGISFFSGDRPDAMLTEIHRQVADNPILRLAERIRRGEPLPRKRTRMGDALRITDDEQNIEEHDIVLTGTNDTRNRRNRRLRRQFKFKERYPQRGERLVCLRNDHTVDDPVYNGSIWQVKRVRHSKDDELPTVELDLTSDYDGISTVEVPLECFTDRAFTYRPGLQLFDYGYALTVHKAQGSEWPSVMLIDESACFRSEARRWLYTAITRAKERLTVVDYR